MRKREAARRAVAQHEFAELQHAVSTVRGIAESIRMLPLKHELTVRRLPDPRPSAVRVEVMNCDGRSYFVGGQEIPITDGSWMAGPFNVPLSFLTGRDEDAKQPPATVRLMFEYRS